MDIYNLKPEDFLMSRSDEIIEYDLDFEGLLNKYGPEGCYEIAKKLMKIADEDMQKGIEQSLNWDD